MKRRMLQVVFLLTLVGSIHKSNGYGRGAPDTTCSSMMPRHGPNAQTSPSPFTTTPLKTSVEPGGQITVRLAAINPADNFRGFLIHATNPASPSIVALGSFINPPPNTKTLTCSPGLQNSLTHGDGRGKATLDITWQAPTDFQGEVQFRATFVKDYNTFWTQVPAVALVRVGRSGGVTPAYQAPTTYSRDQASYPYVPPSTTTSATTTTRIVSTSPNPSTTQWSFAKQTPAPMASAQLPSVYMGCGDVKGCFGLGGTCVQEGSCSAMVTYAVKGQRYEFELWATNTPPNSYVAVAFSNDNLMGDDSVSECTLVNGRVNAYMSYNEGKSNTRLRDPTNGLKLIEGKYSDGNLYCRFERQAQFVIGDKHFDMAKDYLLFLARGPASDNGISYHDRQKTVSSRTVRLAETGAVGANRGTLVKLHGAFMVAAWMFAASCGILFARYFRLTWVGKQFMGKDLWFVSHRMLMVITWILTVIAFILIFIELGGWTSLPVTTNPHAVIGVVTTVLAFIQPFMAYFRPHPGTPKRFIFNWAHWLVGNSSHILGIVCIFLAVDLDKAAIPYWVNWLLVSYVAVHAATHLVLSLAQCCYHADGSRKPTAVFAMRDLAPHQSNQNHFYSTQQDKKEDAHGSTFRRVMLAFYILLVAGFAAAVIATIVTGPWAKQ
ncbi:putative ferric-chelate reductase 1 homolog isoform X2 [Daphnia pulicaria]|nr:putative ferric-chelate reductase 1 homolog isoform X2 [Daphnia pulicaria]XP_046657705.1 putative ferric-chelate reductase 1 homolog isoform X2 [Daphnia pulicaria]